MATTPNTTVTYWEPGQAPTGRASGPVTGKRFGKVAPGGYSQNPAVTLCGAGQRPYGVLGNDAADGQAVLVYRSGAFSVTAGAALAGGDEVQSDSEGKAVKATGSTAAGVCLADVPAGGDAPIHLYS